MRRTVRHNEGFDKTLRLVSFLVRCARILLEVVLSADLYDAETAERYGWVTRAVPADELDAIVDRLARNIAALPEGVIAAAQHGGARWRARSSRVQREL
ncbi:MULTISPECIES: hypothetical protein [unclassified Streptomyces]|uniref:hypothetical protein n=1 Tax=unclassified Streptomyces TaxID=2593676 RepID=UPI0033D431FE